MVLPEKSRREGWVNNFKTALQKPQCRFLLFPIVFENLAKTAFNGMNTAKSVKLTPENGQSEQVKAGAGDPAPMMARAPQPPAGMNQIAQEFWRKKCIHLREIKRLHAIDLDALEVLANLYSDVARTREKMDNAMSDEMFIKHQRAHLEAVKQFKDLSRDFGFTPSSRGKIKGGVVEEKKGDAFDEI